MQYERRKRQLPTLTLRECDGSAKPSPSRLRRTGKSSSTKCRGAVRQAETTPTQGGFRVSEGLRTKFSYRGRTVATRSGASPNSGRDGVPIRQGGLHEQRGPRGSAEWIGEGWLWPQPHRSTPTAVPASYRATGVPQWWRPHGSAQPSPSRDRTRRGRRHRPGQHVIPG